MAINNLTDQLIRDEGVVLHAYPDSLGYLTIGIGRLIDKRKGGGISLAEARFLLDNDIVRVSNEVRRALPWSEKLDEERFGVLLNMAFQMGIAGLLGFKNTLAMIERGDYKAAAAECSIANGPNKPRRVVNVYLSRWKQGSFNDPDTE